MAYPQDIHANSMDRSELPVGGGIRNRNVTVEADEKYVPDGRSAKQYVNWQVDAAVQFTERPFTHKLVGQRKWNYKYDKQHIWDRQGKQVKIVLVPADDSVRANNVNHCQITNKAQQTEKGCDHAKDDFLKWRVVASCRLSQTIARVW